MGLGKTIQATSILHYLHQEHGLCGPFLIVAPMVTLEQVNFCLQRILSAVQWKKELEGWTNMNVVVYHGSADARELIYEKEWFFKDQRRSSKIYKFDVLITTFELVLKETSKLSAVPWQVLI
jgi:chromodomain-helicase-DNA-binding protein 7